MWPIQTCKSPHQSKQAPSDVSIFTQSSPGRSHAGSGISTTYRGYEAGVTTCSKSFSSFDSDEANEMSFKTSISTLSPVYAKAEVSWITHTHLLLSVFYDSFL